MLTLPSAATASNYKLLAGSAYYKQRDYPVMGIVLHITAGLQDLGLSGTDESAEGTIKWALGAKAEVSWNAGADSDGVELCIPDWYTAWQAKGYNSKTVGIEISKLNVDWTVGKNGVTQKWVDATLKNAAKWCAAIVKKHHLPLVLCTKAQVDAKIAAGQKFGFTYHMYTSAGTRSDPGANFPWARFIGFVKAELAAAQTPAPPPDTTVYKKDTDMVLIRVNNTNPVYVSNGIHYRWIQNGTDLAGLQKALRAEGAKGVVTQITAAELSGFGVLAGPDPFKPTAPPAIP